MGQASSSSIKRKLVGVVSKDSVEKKGLPYSEPAPGNLQSAPTREQKRANCFIQPHTDDGGDAYYIGDVYENAKCAEEWAVPTERRPYLRFLKENAKSLPHLEYLAHWMEVTAAPPKWKFIKQDDLDREERAQRCTVCMLDFNNDGPPCQNSFKSTKKLEEALDKSAPRPDPSKVPIRLLIVEDLSRDLVELLGSKFDVDPLFFLSHIGDYLFHNTRDIWVELPDLDVVARQREHFTLQYLRARYFKTPNSFEKAERDSGGFNILRRLDSDRSSERLANGLLDVKGARVTLTRAKTSLWVQPRVSTDDPVLAILLVDPTVTEGHPLWRGYRPFEHTPSMRSGDPAQAPPGKSLYEHAIHWSQKLTAEELALVRTELDAKCIALPMLRLMLADWRTVLKYMGTMLNKIEWEFDHPHWADTPTNIDHILRKLSPWRRNVPYYQSMILESIDRLFPPEMRQGGWRSNATMDPNLVDALHTPVPNTGLPSLLYDFRIVQQKMGESQQRIDTIQSMATNSINVEESRRAVDQNSNLARLTFLATFFIPLNFTSSFLSMSPDFAAAKQTVWLFFAVGIPLTVFALVVVDLSHPQEGILLGRWRALTTGRKPRRAVALREPNVEMGRTMPWPTDRFDSRSR